MGYGSGKTEAGHKRHSGTARWVFHQEAKADARKQRRLESRKLMRKAMTSGEDVRPKARDSSDAGDRQT